MENSTVRIFLYGTLRYAALLDVVADTRLNGTPAVLNDYALATAEGLTFPMLYPSDGAVTEGIAIDVGPKAKRRLDFYEKSFGYRLVEVSITAANVKQSALVYLPEDGRWTPGEAWSLDAWIAAEGHLTVETAKDYMALEGIMPPTQIGAFYGQFRGRADSRLRALASEKSTSFGTLPSVSDVRLKETRHPYARFFSVREDDLTFPNFSGGQSRVVTRAAFLSGDAVTVLPYDPETDSVLIVRQFRYGAFLRGDPQPWCAEPIAGRIDPGESPEAAARREAYEEAGIELDELHLVSRYYPSPGTISEYLYSYIAPVDLSRAATGIHGLESEVEDIESLILPLEAVLNGMASGETDTGPLALSALWLCANRVRFKKRH